MSHQTTSVFFSKEQDTLDKTKSCVSFEKRTIYITGDIDAKTFHRVAIALEALEKEPGRIRILLNSEGGSESDGYAIYDKISMCKNEVLIEGYGNVHSIAAIIFQAGDTRIIAPNATFLIHNGMVPCDEEMQQTAIIDLAQQLVIDNQRYYDILSGASEQPEDVIENWCREDKSFTAVEAVEAGFADAVLKPLKTINKKRR
jgi:ATP-dependent protease ClpP protease subunit